MSVSPDFLEKFPLKLNENETYENLRPIVYLSNSNIIISSFFSTFFLIITLLVLTEINKLWLSTNNTLFLIRNPSSRWICYGSPALLQPLHVMEPTFFFCVRLRECFCLT